MSEFDSITKNQPLTYIDPNYSPIVSMEIQNRIDYTISFVVTHTVGRISSDVRKFYGLTQKNIIDLLFRLFYDDIVRL